MKVLAIESSCDDTSVALVDCSDKGFFVIAEKTASQIEVHKKYGGVVPEVAGRQHAENIFPVIEAVLENHKSKILNQKSEFKPDVIAVTAGPGLVTGLVIGVEAAKALSYLWDVPLVATNHIAGHALSALVQNQKSDIEYPALALVVSGGHTEILHLKSPENFELIGKTQDDAAGEAFDKVGKLLGFEYPGGPKISKLAKDGNTNAIAFPRAMNKKDNFNFSFSGLKTAALYWLRDNKLAAINTNPLAKFAAGIFGINKHETTLNDFCASFEWAIVDSLVSKTIGAAKKYKPKTILLGGGVSANPKLRETLETEIKKLETPTHYLLPTTNYSMDNAAMIAVAGYYKAIKKEFTNWQDIKVDPNWRVY